MYFDDLEVGQSFRAEPATLSEEAIIAFAREWDPQPFHIDPEAASQTHFGGLIASGFQTMLTAFKSTLALAPFAKASMGSPGMEDVRWIKPVRPGETLTTEVEVAALRPSASRSDRGYAVLDHRIVNQSGDLVMTYRSNVIFARRPG
ncbi:MAG: MaoC family dehydratase [Pseudomonadota bacterium]